MLQGEVGAGRRPGLQVNRMELNHSARHKEESATALGLLPVLAACAWLRCTGSALGPDSLPTHSKEESKHSPSAQAFFSPWRVCGEHGTCAAQLLCSAACRQACRCSPSCQTAARGASLLQAPARHACTTQLSCLTASGGPPSRAASDTRDSAKGSPNARLGADWARLSTPAGACALSCCVCLAAGGAASTPGSPGQLCPRRGEGICHCCTGQGLAGQGSGGPQMVCGQGCWLIAEGQDSVSLWGGIS